MADNDEPMIKTPADFGHFLLEKELGHGGMGGVYLARDKMLDRRVGIKVMLKSLGADPKFVERFQREAQAAARLNHPNIAQIYSFGQEQGMPYIAMELVPGGSLDKEMEANPGTLDVAYVMRVGQQVADALALAAESGLVHGDVKPENVLFDSDGNAKLVDFGLAAMQGDSDEIWGTPYYISPEKVRRQKIDYRADIYSLGGTLYHVLTGVPPFDGPDPTAVVKARFDGPPKKPSEIRPDIPPEVDAIIMRMLELEPSMRYPTYQSLLGDFKRYLAKAGPAKAGKSSGPKLKFKGMKPKVASSVTGNTAVDGEIADLQPVDDLGELEEENKSMSVGMMVGLVVGGIVLLILLVVGGLLWYTHSANADKAQKLAQGIADKQEKARQAISNSTKILKEDYEKFHGSVLACNKSVEEAVRGVKAALPDALKGPAEDVFSQPLTPAIVDAIAYTNKLFATQAPAPAAEAKPATTNAVEAASAEKKGDEKKDDGKKSEAKKDDKSSGDKKAGGTKGKAKKDGAKAASKKGDAEDKDAEAEKALEAAEAKAEGKEVKSDAKEAEKQEPEQEKPDEAPAAEEKPDENAVPALQLPPAFKKYEQLWSDLCLCRALDIKFHGKMLKLLEMAKAADTLNGQDEETADQLVKLANDLTEACNNFRRELNEARVKSPLNGIDRRARNFREDAVKKLKLAVERHERALKEKQEAERREAEKKAAAEKHEAEIAEELQKAQEEFERLEGEHGYIKRVDWKGCTNTLMRLKMTTREGKDAVKDLVHRIDTMAGMHRHLIKHVKNFQFSDSSVVMEADEDVLTIKKVKLDGKRKPIHGKDKKPQTEVVRIQWKNFYAHKGPGGKSDSDYAGYMYQFMNALVRNGRRRTGIGPKEWNEHMLGAAFTLKYFYGDEKNVVKKFMPMFVQEAVKGFEPSREWASKWFPDVKLEDSDE